MNNPPITEQIYSDTIFLDELSTKDGLNLMVNEHKKSAIAVKKIINDIELVVKKIVSHIRQSNSSRLIYVGAGTSGRIGLQDGIELYPTFGWPKKRVDFLIAGGFDALLKPIENAEDNLDNALQNFKDLKINRKDVVIGIAASGNTPYTCKVLELSQKVNALTVGISNNKFGNLFLYSDFQLFLDTRQEILAGSTRLKAGTAQKICLNTISTMIMTKLGFVKKGMMVNMVPMNEKLKKRVFQIKKHLNLK